MINQISSLTTTLLLHVTSEPKQEIRRWVPRNEQGEEIGQEQVFSQETLIGNLMSSFLSADRKLPVELQFRSAQMASMCPDAPTYGEVLKAFIRNEDELTAGTKLMLVQVAMLPRINKTGDKKDLATNFAPVISGFKMVDASDEDLSYINKFSKTDYIPTQEELNEMELMSQASGQ